MHRFLTLATACLFSLTLAALGASGDHGRSSSSAKGGNKNASDGKHTGSGDKSGKHPHPMDKGGKQTKGPHGDHKGHHVSEVHPKNPTAHEKKAPPKMAKTLKTLKKLSKSPNVGGPAKSAINTVLAGNFLNADERQDLTNLLAADGAELSEDERKAVQDALDWDALQKKEERYIKVENATGERLTLWLHYQSLAEKDEWDWFPTKPVDPEKALRYILEPGSNSYLSDNASRIAAGRARLWAESESGHKWTGYRDQDLQLKPSADRKDLREMGTYALRIVGDENGRTQAKSEILR
jgi:hypothetical protein